MTMSQYSHVTDDLLSAYLDDAVTASERTLVEAAVANDPDIAWRLMTLQYTVDLLGKLPDIALPRSFTLSEAMVAEAAMEPAGAPRLHPTSPHQSDGFWASWRAFWQGGSPFLRNTAAASLAAFLVLAVIGSAFTPGGASTPFPSTESLAVQSDGPGGEKAAVTSLQLQTEAQPQAKSAVALVVATESAPDAGAAEAEPAPQVQHPEGGVGLEIGDGLVAKQRLGGPLEGLQQRVAIEAGDGCVDQHDFAIRLYFGFGNCGG
jgi:hypothetical protein